MSQHDKEKNKISLKDKFEIIASIMTILVSLTILAGFFLAHKSGFFTMIHQITEHHHSKIVKR